MTWKRCVGLIPVLLILTACALGNAPSSATTIPPVTLAVPPTMVFAGDCEGTEELNNWLQSTDFLVSEFLTTLNGMMSLNREDMRAQVLHLGKVREEANKVVTPDCAQAIQLLMVEAMDTAVTNFQAYANNDLQDLGNIVAEVIGQVDRVIAAQNDLKTRLEEQFAAQRQS